MGLDTRKNETVWRTDSVMSVRFGLSGWIGA